MAAPTAKSNLSNGTIFNKVLLYLGLERIPENQFNNLLFNTDQEIVYTELQSIARNELSKGWWFNTMYDYVIPAGDFSFHDVDHPTLGITLEVLSVRNKPRNKCDVQDYTRWKPAGGSETIYTADDTVPEYDGIADIIYGVELPQCPPEFVDYVVKLTAYTLSSSFDVPFNPDLLDRAEMNLQRANAQNKPKENVFRRP